MKATDSLLLISNSSETISQVLRYGASALSQLATKYDFQLELGIGGLVAKIDGYPYVIKGDTEEEVIDNIMCLKILQHEYAEIDKVSGVIKNCATNLPIATWTGKKLDWLETPDEIKPWYMLRRLPAYLYSRTSITLDIDSLEPLDGSMFEQERYLIREKGTNRLGVSCYGNLTHCVFFEDGRMRKLKDDDIVYSALRRFWHHWAPEDLSMVLSHIKRD